METVKKRKKNLANFFCVFLGLAKPPGKSTNKSRGSLARLKSTNFVKNCSKQLDEK